MSRSATARWPWRRKRSAEMEMGKETKLDGMNVKIGATAWHEVEHNRRYGADCVLRLGRVEAVAEIAAPHPKRGTPSGTGPNQGPKESANGSGARGEHKARRRGQPDNTRIPTCWTVSIRSRHGTPIQQKKANPFSEGKPHIMKFEGDCGLPLVGPVDLPEPTAF